MYWEKYIFCSGVLHSISNIMAVWKQPEAQGQGTQHNQALCPLLAPSSPYRRGGQVPIVPAAQGAVSFLLAGRLLVLWRTSLVCSSDGSISAPCRAAGTSGWQGWQCWQCLLTTCKSCHFFCAKGEKKKGKKKRKKLATLLKPRNESAWRLVVVGPPAGDTEPHPHPPRLPRLGAQHLAARNVSRRRSQKTVNSEQ